MYLILEECPFSRAAHRGSFCNKEYLFQYRYVTLGRLFPLLSVYFNGFAKLRALRAHVPTNLECLFTHVPMGLACLHAHML